MGLDMYLRKRNKLTDAQNERIVQIQNRRKKIMTTINEELSKLEEEANRIYKPPREYSIEEYTKYCDDVREYVKSKKSDNYRVLEEEKKVLEDEYRGLLNEEEIYYWRKHANLNGFMEKLYYAKGGEGKFNCTPLILTKEDVKKVIEFESTGEEQEVSQGYFWGKSSQSDRDESITVFTNILNSFDFDKYDLVYLCWH